MRKSIADRIIEAMGRPCISRAYGLQSYRRGSNLRHALESAAAKIGGPVVAIAGAHRRRGTEGWEWLIFAGPETTKEARIISRCIAMDWSPEDGK